MSLGLALAMGPAKAGRPVAVARVESTAPRRLPGAAEPRSGERASVHRLVVHVPSHLKII